MCLSPSPEGEGWDGGAFDFKIKSTHLNLPLQGEDFKAKQQLINKYISTHQITSVVETDEIRNIGCYSDYPHPTPRSNAS